MSIYKEQSLANLQISNFTLLTSSIEGVAKIVMRERGDIYILNFSNELRIQRKFQKIYASLPVGKFFAIFHLVKSG